MLTYQIVVENDNVARWVIQHNDLLGKTYAAPQVGVLSKTYVDAYKVQFSLPDVQSVLASLGITNGLSQEDLNAVNV